MMTSGNSPDCAMRSTVSSCCSESAQPVLEIRFAVGVRCGAVAQPVAVRNVKMAAVCRTGSIDSPRIAERPQLTHKAASIRSKFSMLASDYGAFASDVSLIPRYQGDSVKSDDNA
jgi:hypothetical protein